MAVQVFHSNLERFFEEPFTVWAPENFTLVAEVAVDDLDDAYTLTNHGTGLGNGNWLENEGVTLRTDAIYVRGTGVGDVLVDSSGRAHRVLLVGFDAI